MRPLSTVLLAVLALAPSEGCGFGELDKPRPPDTSRLLRDLEAPTGSLGDLSAEAQSTLLVEALTGLRLMCGEDLLLFDECTVRGKCGACDFVDRIAETVQQLAWALKGGSPDGEFPDLPGIDGALTVDAICRGWGAPTPDPAHGSVHANVSFSGHGLDPVIWGRFEKCAERTLHRKLALRLQGDFIYTFEPARHVPFDEVGTVPALFAFDGTVFDDELQLEHTVHAAIRRRLDATGEREFLAYTPRGSFVFKVVNGVLEVTGAQQRYRCFSEEMVCEAIAL